jgi:hypothetical protein
MESPEHVRVAPAPWDTTAETYWLALYLKAGADGDSGVYAPLEFSSPSTTDPQKSGNYHGGLGLIVIVRYRDTPCGSLISRILITITFATFLTTFQVLMMNLCWFQEHLMSLVKTKSGCE